MARLLLVTGADPAALLRAAAAPFCAAGAPAEPLPLLVVRQGGLRDAVNELAAEHECAGWLGKPIAVFAELPDLLTGGRAPLDALEREALLQQALAEVQPTSLRIPGRPRAIVASLDQLFGDLVADGVQPGALATALANTETDPWALGRNADLEALYAAYLRLVAALPPVGGIARTDGRDGLRLAAQAVVADPSAVGERLRRPLQPAGQLRSIAIYGLADLRRGWRHLLDALRASRCIDELRVYLPDVVDASLDTWARAHADEKQELPDVAPTAPAIAHLRASLFAIGGDRITATPDLRVVAAPDTTRELEQVARRIKQLLHEGDENGERPAPHQVAVVARKARPYLTLAASTLASYGIPIHARLRHTLGDAPAVAALLRVLRVAGSGWAIRGLTELANSPYFDVALDVGLLQQLARTARPRSLDAWRSALDDLVVRSAAGSPDDADEPADALERRRARAAIARDRWTEFSATAATLGASRTLADWIGFTLDAIGGSPATPTSGLFGLAANAQRPLDASSPAILRDALRVDVAAIRAVADLLVQWRSAAAMDPRAEQRLDVAAWAAELEELFAEQEVTVRTGSAGGVQLVEALAAEGRSFAHVFIVGLGAGSFPAEAATDPLFTDAERERLLVAGAPVEPARVWQEREAALFTGLARSARRTLHLSYAYADHRGAPQLPSAYLDDVQSRFDEKGLVDTIGGSALVPGLGTPLWSEREAMRSAAVGLRSGQADELLAAVARGAAGPDAIGQLLHAIGVERKRTMGRGVPRTEKRENVAHDWNGRIADPVLLERLVHDFGDRVWSATQLEAYGRCPFSFFGKYALRAHALDAVDDEEVGARDIGTVMHTVLAQTYRRLGEAHPDNPLSHDHFDEARAIIAEEVGGAIAAQGGAFAAVPGLRVAREREIALLLEAYLYWEMAENDKRDVKRRPVQIEVGFGMAASEHPVVELEHNGKTLRLRGQMDRVDEMIGEGFDGYRYVVDHKLGKSAFANLTELQASGGILQLALYMQSLRQIEPDAKLWGGAYQIVRSQAATAKLDRCSVTKKGLQEAANKTQQSSDEMIRGASKRALEIVDGVVSGHFPARTPDKVDCLAYCDYRDACREERIKSW